MASTKTAAPTFQQSETNKQDAAKLIFQLPLAALALGAVGRGALGLRDLFTTQTLQPPGIVPGTQFIGMPRLQKEKDKQQKLAKAGIPWQPSTHPIGWVADLASKPFYEHGLASDPAAGKTHAYDNSKNPSGIPYTYTLGLPLAALGFGAGYGGMDKLLDSRRRAERKQEIERVKQQYYELLQGKTASEADMFDQLAEKTAAVIEKTANPAPAPPQHPLAPISNALPDWLSKETLPQLGGMAANLYGASALLAALGAGKLSYDYFRSTSKRKTLEEALRRRAASDSGPGPAMVYTE